MGIFCLPLVFPLDVSSLTADTRFINSPVPGPFRRMRPIVGAQQSPAQQTQ